MSETKPSDPLIWRAGRQDPLTQWMKAAGILRPEDQVTRVIMDFKIGDVARVYIERYGTVRLLELKPPDLSGAKIRIVPEAASE